jgi:ribosomal protein S18 acetylase RimI-like enzyme
MFMTRVKSGIEIVQYHEGWAKEVAKMWNLSRDGWGGDTRVMTEEQVKQKEAKSENIVLYLAVDAGEVVGYCGLSEYKDDIGSLYIPLLNVRPDYHGQKVGKKLLLCALEKTIELGWPRLDLYTWPGNTKAVPLYKKCGFFWEDRDDTTHLMNFIPQVLQTPLLKPIFSDLDWYHSSERMIQVKPDGKKENGFTHYEYSWRNESSFARVQFERTGRGISLIETDEFLLQILMDDHELIEQEQQTFKIKFINKTSSPVTVKATGSSQGRVEYNLDMNMVVEKEAFITGTVTIQSGEEPSPWKTHPYVSVNVSLNGLDCELRLGVFPVLPAKIDACFSGNLCFLNKEGSIELVVKNNLKEEVQYTIHFPENDQVTFESKQYYVHLPEGGKNCISVPIVVKKHGYYQPKLQIVANKADGTELLFTHDVSIAFKGLGKKFGGESKDYWHIYNGLSQVNIRKRDLLMTAAKNSLMNQPMGFFPPKLGKPYSNEFAKKKPESVSSDITDTSILLKIDLKSDEMPGLYLSQVIELFGDGIIHQGVEIENRGVVSHDDVAVSLSHFHELGQTYFPLDNQVVYFSENRMIEFGDLIPENISGNWYFSDHKPESIGVAWPKNSKASPEGWQFVIVNELGSLAPGETRETEKVILSIGAFQQWEDFRAYAEETTTVMKSELSSEQSLTSNQVVVSSELDLSLKSYRNSHLDGNLHISISDEEIYNTCITAEEEKTVHSFNIETSKLEPITILDGEFKENGMSTMFEELILSPTNQDIVHKHPEENSIQVSNGCITLNAATDYYPGLYSLKVNGNEWLDHSYPNQTAKSWWNPWAGGMKTAPSGLTTFSLLKEKHSAIPIEKWDRQGNKWCGLAIRTEIQEHPQWKGVQYVQYYLMLPGVPLVSTYLDVENSGGRNLKEDKWVTDFFIGGEDLANLSVNVNDNQQTNLYKTGVQELPLVFHEDNYITSKIKKDKLYLIPSLYMQHTEAYTNKHAFQIMSIQSALPSENCAKTAPQFMLFDQRVLSTSLLRRLRGVQF